MEYVVAQQIAALRETDGLGAVGHPACHPDGESASHE